jgi:hypothetical protein
MSKFQGGLNWRQIGPGRYAEPMKRLIALLALFAPVVFAQEQFIDWLTNYREALTQAKAAKKPVFLEFRCEA